MNKKSAIKAPSSQNGTIRVEFEGIDAAKLNELLVNVSDRLKSGSFGNFYLEGSALNGDDRHAQLKAVFELIKELQAVKDLMERKLAVEGVKENKKPGGGGSNQIAMIRNVVQQQLEEKNRDLSIQVTRMVERVEKLEISKAQAAPKHGAIKQPHAPKLESVERRLKLLEDELNKEEPKLGSIQKRLQWLEFLSIDKDSTAESTETRLKRLEKECCNELAKLGEQISDVASFNDGRHEDNDDRLRELFEWKDAQEREAAGEGESQNADGGADSNEHNYEDEYEDYEDYEDSLRRGRHGSRRSRRQT